MRTEFQQQLQTLHVELMKMGGLCEEAISLAAKLILGDSEISPKDIHEVEMATDRKEREIEALCMQILLQQQPVAGDFRAVSSALKMISDMERIGDQTDNIGELAPYLTKCRAQDQVQIGEMARATVQMVTDSVEAFVKSDLPMARRVMQADDEVDRLFYDVKEDLIEQICQRKVDPRASLDLLMAAKYFERIGDHAVNIAEWVEYFLTGSHKNQPIPSGA